MTPPSRLAFWRLVLSINAVLPFLALWDMLRLAEKLGVLLRASPAWMAFLGMLALAGPVALLGLIATLRSSPGGAWSRARERTLSLLELPARIRPAGMFFLLAGLAGYTVLFSVPYSRDLLGGQGWVRSLAFWSFSLAGMYGLKAVKQNLSWLSALLLILLFQTALHLLVTQLSGVSAYPFAMGWSETSRFYYPSLFLSEKIFGNRLPWPILHPSLHLLLVPPYWIDAPLWFHRFWQVFLRFALLGLTAYLLLRRLSIKERVFRGLLWLWMTLFLFQGPVYFHLAIPVILMLWGFSARGDRRTWFFLVLASVWSGLSRINWYPMPGLLASALFLLEVPIQGQKWSRYLLKPALWTVVGFVVAFVTQRAYIALSGIPNPEFFYTSLTSNLLWYRLFPNASYRLGVLPAALIASLPVCTAIFLSLCQRRADLPPLRLGLLLAALAVLFAGGLVVSMKIGGGVDIHNLDAYWCLLLIVTAYIFLRQYVPENAGSAIAFSLPWWLTLLLVAVPAWFLAGANGGSRVFDPVRTASVMDALQAHVDQANQNDGEILFITQRHLVSMRMLDGVEMVPEYEREELMEMAMGENRAYLQIFAADMQRQRFAAIVVDPLTYRLLGRNYVFGEENNAWVRNIMKPILCNYQEDIVFPADQVAIYTPQQAPRQCP